MIMFVVDKVCIYELGILNDLFMIAVDIIYEGAVVGIVFGSGLVWLLVVGDVFVGFVDFIVNNSVGVASVINVRVRCCGFVVLFIGSLVVMEMIVIIYLGINLVKCRIFVEIVVIFDSFSCY